MKIQIITLFPEMFQGVFDHSMLFKAQEKKIIDLQLVNLRDFGEGPRKTVDDAPYGGGDGMVLKVGPLSDAIAHAKEQDVDATTLLMTPRGVTYKQSTAKRLSVDAKGLIIVCGRYEGYDERITAHIDEQISIGGYVLTGGEIPSMIITDSVTRLLPGVLGGETSAEIESFADDETLEYPQYTRPDVYNDMEVPEVLLSGNHQAIDTWRKTQSELITTQQQNNNQE